MGRIRNFKKLNDIQQKQTLFELLALAMKEHPDVSFRSRPHSDDLIDLACQYNSSVKREDFDDLRNIKIGEIIDSFNLEIKKTNPFKF